MKKIMVLTTFILLFSCIAIQAENYYMSPKGSDTNIGTSTGTAWATLGHAQSQGITGGDTLFIMGGTYINAQHWATYNNTSGGNEIDGNLVFKAYGDSVAIFQNTGETDQYYQRYWMFYGGADYVVIDGFSYLNPSDSLFIKLEGREEANYILVFTGGGSDRAEHNVIRGIEIDGNFPEGKEYTVGGPMKYAIGFDYCAMDTVQSCYIHHVRHPTGDILPGDGTDVAQGGGECIFARSVNRLYIADNTFYNSNHAIISIETYLDYPDSKYNKIINNNCSNEWGGGIYLQDNASYNLVEGNIIEHIGETTTYGKAGITLSGSHNTARGNVIYSPENKGLNVESMRFRTTCKIADSNLVYNNTVFGTEGKGLSIVVKGDVKAANSCVDASVWGNKFINNIFYKSHGNVASWCAYESEMLFFLGDANDDDNWIEPDADDVLPSSTHFGYNFFYNNCIRKDAHDGNWTEMILHFRDLDYYGTGPTAYWSTCPFSIDSLENLDPTAWRSNITDIPNLASESPDSYGDKWWYLQNNSPCIDAGIIVNDRIGEYVNSLYPGYGWSNLWYLGTAPDIGANESNGENPATISTPMLNKLKPGRSKD